MVRLVFLWPLCLLRVRLCAPCPCPCKGPRQEAQGSLDCWVLMCDQMKTPVGRWDLLARLCEQLFLPQPPSPHLLCVIFVLFGISRDGERLSESGKTSYSTLGQCPFCFSSPSPSQFAVFQEMSLIPQRSPFRGHLWGGRSRASFLACSSSSLTSRHREQV